MFINSFLLFAIVSLFSSTSSLSPTILEDSLNKLLIDDFKIEHILQDNNDNEMNIRNKRSLKDLFDDDDDDDFFPIDIFANHLRINTRNDTHKDKVHHQKQHDEFDKKINEYFHNVQKKVLNHSISGIKDDFNERYNKTEELKDDYLVRQLKEKGPDGYVRREKTYKIPTKDGVKIVRKGLRKYKNNMENWVEHTFVKKPKSVVKEEKVKFEKEINNNTNNYNINNNNNNKSIPVDKLKEFWAYENSFDNLMRKYEKAMNQRVFKQYNKMYEHFDELFHTNQSSFINTFSNFEKIMNEPFFSDEHENQRKAQCHHHHNATQQDKKCC